DLQHLGDDVHHQADFPAVVVEDHGAGVVAHRRRYPQALPQVDHRDGGAFVPQDSLEKLRRLGKGRGTLVAQDPLHLKDVEGEVLAGHAETHQLDIVARAHWIRSPNASISRIGISSVPSPLARRPMPAAHGRVSPGGTGSGGSRPPSSASSTSNPTSRPPRFTSTIAEPRSTGGV